MKKIMLIMLILGMTCAIMSCKKTTADPEKNTGNTTVETSESAEAATYEPIETEETLQIDLEEDQAGEVAPD